jgi:very-short-patch-repair endonuclease
VSTDLERKLRANSTAPERRMWRLLYPLRTGEFHFRKQERIGPFYVDFACHHASLIIEVDGETHYVDGAPERDEKRDAFLRGEGYRVLRFTNDDVMHNADGAFRVVTEALAGRPTRPPRRLASGHEEAASPQTIQTQQ